MMKEPKKRFLVSVSVLGSVGPIRFLVNEDDKVSSVISTALKSYARQGRIPVLGFDVNNFIFYSSSAGFNALNPQEKIGSMDETNFLLCKREREPLEKVEGREESKAREGQGWKNRLRRSVFGEFLYKNKSNSTKVAKTRSFISDPF